MGETSEIAKSISQTADVQLSDYPAQTDNSSNQCTCSKMKKQRDDEERGYHYNFDPRDILVVGGLEKDTAHTTNQQEIMKQLWQKGRPPRNISERNPVVSARQLELIRGQIYGKIRVHRHKP